MALASRFTDYVPKRAGGHCRICGLLQSMTAEDAQALRDALAARDRYPSTAIARILRDEGYEVGNSSVDRHRRGECKGD